MKMKYLLYGLFGASVCTAFSVIVLLGLTAFCSRNQPIQTFSGKAAADTSLFCSDKRRTYHTSDDRNVRLVSANVRIQQNQPVLCDVEVKNSGRRPLDRVELLVLLKDKRNRPVRAWKSTLSVRGIYDGLPLKPGYIFRMEEQQIPLCSEIAGQDLDGTRFEVSISRVYEADEEDVRQTMNAQEKQAYIHAYVRLLSKPATITRQKEAAVSSAVHIANTGGRDIQKVAVSLFFRDRLGIVRGEIQWWFQRGISDEGEKTVYHHLPVTPGAFSGVDSFIYPLPAYQREHDSGYRGFFARMRCTVEITDICW